MPGKSIPQPPPMSNKNALPPPPRMPASTGPPRHLPPRSSNHAPFYNPTSTTQSSPKPLPQPQSPFLNLFPAELRNTIYTHVFTPASPLTNPTDSTTAHHPLSLLSTCRQIYAEAHLLASSTYVFTLSAEHITTEHPPHPTLDQIMARLSSLQRTSIQHIAIYHGVATSSLLSACLDIFPSLSTIVLKIPTETYPLCPLISPFPLGTHPFLDQAADDEEYLRAQAVTSHAPPVFLWALHEATQPRRIHTRLLPSAALQQRWEVAWPQIDSAAAYTQIVKDGDGLREELVMDADAVGEVDGVQKCVCGEEGHVVWSKAVLSHRGGKGERSVDVEFIPWTEEKKKPEEVVKKAKPGKVVSVPSLCSAGGGGMGYAGSEAYWEGLRRRNGGLGAGWRGWWRTSTTSTARRNVSYEIAKSCRIS